MSSGAQGINNSSAVSDSAAKQAFETTPSIPSKYDSELCFSCDACIPQQKHIFQIKLLVII